MKELEFFKNLSFQKKSMMLDTLIEVLFDKKMDGIAALAVVSSIRVSELSPADQDHATNMDWLKDYTDKLILASPCGNPNCTVHGAHSHLSKKPDFPFPVPEVNLGPKEQEALLQKMFDLKTKEGN